MGYISKTFNFDNIGHKIKALAKWACWITILLLWVACAIAFIGLVSDGDAESCWIPLVAAVVGPYVIWVGSWGMYAFGELVERTGNIDDNTGTGVKKSSVQRDADRKKIEKLEALRAKGLITEEEYNRALE